MITTLPTPVNPHSGRSDSGSSNETQLSAIRERILQYITVVTAILTTMLFFINMYSAVRDGIWWRILAFTLMYAMMLIITFGRRLPYAFRGYSLMILFFLFSTLRLTEDGLNGDGRYFMFAFALLTAILMGSRAGFFAVILSGAAVAFIGTGMSTGLIPMPDRNLIAMSGNGLQWLQGGFIFVLLTFIVIASLALLLSSLEQTLSKQRQLASELELERATLETRVVERTQALERRASQLEVAGQIAHQISEDIDPTELLQTAVDLIRSKFGFYHAGLFLVDDQREYALLQAATGEPGRRMVEAGHQLRIGSEGIVGFVIAKDQSRIALDVGSDAVHFKNPNLPMTRSEMAVPLHSGGKVIGAIDVQSEQESAFTLEDTKILQIIADQLAVAIAKANLVANLRQTVTELETGNRLYTQKAWRVSLRSSKRNYAYLYRQSKLEMGASVTAESTLALQKGETVTALSPEKGKDDTPVTILAVPIKLRGQTLGVLNFRFKGSSVSKDTINLIETATNRLAVALENARLLEEIRDRAEREHVVTDISARVRSSTDVENILRTTVMELGRSLGVDEVHVQLRTEDQN